jgi:biotin carboxyl carrier protein
VRKRYFVIREDSEAAISVERDSGTPGAQVFVHAKGSEPERRQAMIGADSVLLDGRIYRLQQDGDQILVLSGRKRTRVTVRDRPSVAMPGSLARKQALHRVLTAPLPGQIAAVLVKPGDMVRRGDRLVVIEAMKMQNPVLSERDARVSVVHIAVGEAVQAGTKLLELDD